MHGGLSRAGKEKLSNGQNLKEIYKKWKRKRKGKIICGGRISNFDLEMKRRENEGR